MRESPAFLKFLVRNITKIILMPKYNLLIELETTANELPWNKINERWRDEVELDIHICNCPEKLEVGNDLYPGR